MNGEFLMGSHSTPVSTATAPSGSRAVRRKLVQWWFGAVAAVVLLGWFGVYIASFREPKYRSKPLSYWIDLYNQHHYDDDQKRTEAADAIHRIGTNALPIAIRWLCVSDSKLKVWLKEQSEKQSFINLKFTEAETFDERAETVFDLLGPEAVAAVPGLEKLMDHPETAERAVRILCRLGQDSLPALERSLTNRNAEVRSITARDISGGRSWYYPWWAIDGYEKPLPAVFPNDLLLRLLKDPEANVREFAARAIGESAAFRNISPGQGMPALIEALRDPVLENRNADVAALGCFGGSASNAAPALLEILQTDMGLDVTSCGAILGALGALGIEKSRTIPALTEQLAGSTNDGTRIWAIETLASFDPLAKPAVPLMLKCMAEDNPMASAALRALDDMKADHARIIPVLRKHLDSGDFATRVWAATELGRFGPEAKSAVSSLIEAARPANHNLRTVIYLALLRIDPVAANLNARALDVAPPDPGFIGLLIKSLADQNPETRCAAADCLGEYGSDAGLAVPALRAALGDKDKSVREAAGIALKSIRPVDATNNPTNIVSK